MKSFDEIMQDLVNESYDTLVYFAKRSLETLIPPVSKMLGSNDDVANTFLVLFSTCIGADGKLTSLEADFINDVLDADHDYESVSNVVSGIPYENGKSLIVALSKALDDNEQAALITLCASFCAVDETISRDEVAMIKQLFG